MAAATNDRLLKAKTSALLRATGATTFIEVKVFTASRRSYKHQVPATDLDVLAVRVSPDLSSTRIIAECKSGAKDVLEQLYKLAGVVSSQRADLAMLVRTNIGAHVREIARTLPVWIAAADEVDFLLKTWVPDAAKVVATEQKYLERLVKYGADVGKIHPAETAILLHEHWSGEDGKAIAVIVRAVSNIANATVLSEPEYGVLAIGLQAFGVRLLRFAGQVMRLQTGDPLLGTRLQLAGSARQLRERENLARLIASALPSDQAGQVTGDPEYVSDLSELALRLFRNAPKAYRSVAILEELTRWILEGSSTTNISALEARVRDEDPVALKLAQDIALALCAWAKVEPTVFRALLSL